MCVLILIFYYFSEVLDVLDVRGPIYCAAYVVAVDEKPALLFFLVSNLLEGRK